MEDVLWTSGVWWTLVLTLVLTLVSLSLVSLLCLSCKRKSKIIHEEHQTQDLHTFQRGGSVFAVVQSKPVTRANQIMSSTFETLEEYSPDADYEQPDYENVNPAPPTASPDHTYVAPLPNVVYANETITDANQTVGVYENFIKSLSIKDDEDDYVNFAFQDGECGLVHKS
ncbi:hypothetical protein JOB18_012905 [Solea senegalensis]|uniref:Linker for activation of T-cells family member 2 n=1 Tax=Solea senegalensis TaxID=28829 RepID=A0AAV6SE17_SOLSE|nr:hypothetical protein JOB18_012905 [Solea senegalensis]